MGIYVIKDTQTSLVWEEYGGSSTDFNRSRYYFIIYLNR
jgi:hypothetical protein